MNINFPKNNNEGFLVLFTVLIAVVVLTIVVGITSTAYKEAILSNNARNSQQAFFSADTGLECALFLDKEIHAFVVGDPSGITASACGDLSINDVEAIGDIFSFELDTSSISCSKVIIDKSVILDEDVPELTSTQIISKGYNVRCEDTVAPGSLVRVVERQLEATYGNPLIIIPGGAAL